MKLSDLPIRRYTERGLEIVLPNGEVVKKRSLDPERKAAMALAQLKHRAKMKESRK